MSTLSNILKAILKRLRNYLWENAGSVSRILNTLTGGKSEHTLSARAGLNAEQQMILWKFVATLIDILFAMLGDKEHTKKEAEKVKKISVG